MPPLFAFFKLVVRWLTEEGVAEASLKRAFTPSLFNKVRVFSNTVKNLAEKDAGSLFEKRVRSFFRTDEIKNISENIASGEVLNKVNDFIKKKPVFLLKKMVGHTNYDTITSVLNKAKDQDVASRLAQYNKVWFREGQIFGSSAINAFQFVATSEVNKKDTNQVRNAVGNLNVVFIKQKKTGSYTYYNVLFSWVLAMLKRKGKNGSGAWSYFLDHNPYFALKRELSRDSAVMRTFKRQVGMTSIAKSRRGRQLQPVNKIKIVKRMEQIKRPVRARKG